MVVHNLIFHGCFGQDGRCADVEDILPDGFKVKKGDEVFYAAYAMGRMPYIWGEDAEDFRPERWLNNGVFQPESPFKFVAFHVRISSWRLFGIHFFFFWVEQSMNKTKIDCRLMKFIRDYCHVLTT